MSLRGESNLSVVMRRGRIAETERSQVSGRRTKERPKEFHYNQLKRIRRERERDVQLKMIKGLEKDDLLQNSGNHSLLHLVFTINQKVNWTDLPSTMMIGAMDDQGEGLTFHGLLISGKDRINND